jgi:hypothetical protein
MSKKTYSNSNSTVTADQAQQPQEQSAEEPRPATPMDFLFSQIDIAEETPMGWAIDILCNAQMAIRYRQIFRAAAEQLGEIGVYRLLGLMVQNTHHTKHNQLFISAVPAISSARLRNASVKFPEGMPNIPDASRICHAVMTRAAGIRQENERIRTYGNVRIVPQ